MGVKRSLIVVALPIALLNPASPARTQGAGAESPIPFAYCKSDVDSYCIESLEYRNKDHFDRGFQRLKDPTVQWSQLIFDTDGTNFETTNGVSGGKLIVEASRYRIVATSPDYAPGYVLDSPVFSGPTQIRVTDKDVIVFGIRLMGTPGQSSDDEPWGRDSKRLGDSFRMRLRIGNSNPVAFETHTANFDFHVATGSSYNILTAEGTVAEYFNVPSGQFENVCNEDSKALSVQNAWYTRSYSAVSATNQKVAPFAARMMSECPVELPYLDIDGVIKFKFSSPHFRPDGVTPITGTIEVQMPADSWPILAAQESKSVTVSYGRSPLITDSERIVTSDKVKYLIPDVHFSTPSFGIGLPIRGKLGKKILTQSLIKRMALVLPVKSRTSWMSLTPRTCTATSKYVQLKKKGNCTIKLTVSKRKNPTVLGSQRIRIRVT